MDLDSRIIEGKRPLNCLDVDIAKKYIGQKGYLSNSLCAFKDLESTDYQLVYATLKEVNSRKLVAFIDDFDGEAGYFLPDEWVTPKKKYRPFTGIEFAEKFNLRLNSIIHLREISVDQKDYCYNYKVVFTGYRWNDKDFEVLLNGWWHSLQSLLERYEYEENGEWYKFGVEENG